MATNNQEKTPHPNWIGLYALMSAVIGLFFIEEILSFSVTIHRILQIGLILALFVLVELWLRANKQALYMEDLERYRENMRRLQISTHQPPVDFQSLPVSDENNRKSHPKFVPARWLVVISVIGTFLHHKDP